jgi:hypothetical protein
VDVATLGIRLVAVGELLRCRCGRAFGEAAVPLSIDETDSADGSRIALLRHKCRRCARVIVVMEAV